VASRVWSVAPCEKSTGQAPGALRPAETAPHPLTGVEALSALGGDSLHKGDLENAIQVLERGLALSREWKFEPWALLSRLGYAYALSVRLPEALRLLGDIARSDTTVNSMGIGRAIQLVWLGEACALDQRLDEAVERAQEALSLARLHGERGDEAWALRLLGDIAVRRNDLNEVPAAVDHYRRALALATTLGMRPLVAHCHLGLAMLYRAAGQREVARNSFVIAAGMYQEMDMRAWLSHAEPFI